MVLSNLFYQRGRDPLCAISFIQRDTGFAWRVGTIGTQLARWGCLADDIFSLRTVGTEGTNANLMRVKDGQGLTTTVVSRPKDGQKAWIDVGPQEQESLADILTTIGWDSAYLMHLDLFPARSQIQYAGDVVVLRVFVSQDQGAKPLTILLGPDVLVTVRSDEVGALQDICQELSLHSDILESTHYLLYEILERVADGYLQQMDAYEEEFDALEESILNGEDRARAVFALRHTLHNVRGNLADMRRIAARLSRRQFRNQKDNEPNVFVDVYDGFYHVIDNIDSLRDNLTGLVDLQLNQRSTRLNEVMKFLTIFSTIFLPLSFITGFLGMNLKSMPELAMPYGQEITILLMLIVAGTMLYVFKRRNWL